MQAQPSTGAVELLLVAFALVLAVGACEREALPPTIPPSGDAVTGAVSTVYINPGPAATPVLRVTNPYAGNERAENEGKQLYSAMNCAGCHGINGGGGMGPPLRDSVWIYGGDPLSIYQSIMLGRPAGMPTWKGKIPDAAAWKIVAYIQSLGGAVSESAETTTVRGPRGTPGTTAP